VTSATRAEPGALLILGRQAPSLRRRIGPVAWAVLECLAEHAVERGDVTVSRRSVRGLADDLDLSKDSVARALQRLRRDGLVAHVGDRGGDGRFGRGHYVLSLPADVFAPEEAASQRAPSRGTRTGPKQSTQQLLLIVDGLDDGSP
jgi:hypothetical protein